MELEKELNALFGLGQTYWQQADSESYKQNRKSDETLSKAREKISIIFGFVNELQAKLAAMESQKSIATLRVTNKGFSVSLANYVAYALPEGDHVVFSKPVPADKPAVSVPDGWEQIILDAMDEGFAIRRELHNLADGGLVIDDTQIGVEFAIKKFKDILAASPSHSQQSEPSCLFQLFRDAIAWGCTYGPAVSREQWAELRDGKANSLINAFIEKVNRNEDKG